jgi:3-hydroxyacyl-CoA dehydrogenase/enoyl-CoA hydratase/3-hydroxybutyryl-CoA epimerase
VVKEKRFGRKNGKGFYDYPEKGVKRLWPGLGAIASHKLDPDLISVQDLKDRFLYTQALEAARCMEENVVTDPREADVGSILGFGFAPFSGGTISFIDGLGIGAFVVRAKSLAAKFGDRFLPGAELVEMAKSDESFYARFGPRAKGSSTDAVES